MKTEHRVFITASASCSCAGANSDELFANILSGKSGIKQDLNYIANASPAIGKLDATFSFFNHLKHTCQAVLGSSSLDDFSETLLVVGSSVGGMQKSEEIFFGTGSYKNIDPHAHHIQAIVNQLNETFSFYDDISFSTACTSSANAIGYGYEVLKKGLYKNVLVVGADSLSQTTVGGFITLGVLSSNPCKPFDVARDGMNVSEGIASLLLETKANENAVEVCGVGYSSDAYHMTHPHPDGRGAISSMQKALSSANIEAKDVAYVNAHGTGTMANDEAEANAIATLFSHKPYVSSTKSITGHTLGAAGALEAIISCKVIQEQTIPKSTALDEAESKELNLSTANQKTEVNYVMSNSFAFGGNNCSLVFGRLK